VVVVNIAALVDAESSRAAGGGGGGGGVGGEGGSAACKAGCTQNFAPIQCVAYSLFEALAVPWQLALHALRLIVHIGLDGAVATVRAL
jgi:hypothetical protein